MRPDKKKVVDEVWDDARIDSFLDKEAMGDEAADHSILLNAYRSMRPEDFARFLPRFVGSGRSVDALSSKGETLAAVIATHRHSEPFLLALKSASAGI
ncbi:MAG: PA4642 family protein [Pseudomonadales bacterium]